MGNILEFLRGVLTDGDAQRMFRADPVGHLEAAGFGDLAGEDVVEGVAVLRRSLPDELATALWAFAHEDELPAVRPGDDETEIDAAVRVLTYAVDQVPSPAEGAAVAEAQPAPEPEPAPELEPEPVPEPGPATEVAAGPAAEETPLEPSAPVTVDVAAPPSPAAFAESMAAVVADARDRFDEAIRRVVADAEVQVRDVAIRYEELVRQAEVDRESARRYLERSRKDADELLDPARQQVEAARRWVDD